MAVLDIRAFCACDGCGEKMTISIDAASKTGAELPTVFEVVEDHVRGGIGCREGGMTSVQGGKMLCSRCTSTVDDFVTEDRNATAEEVDAAISQDKRQ